MIKTIKYSKNVDLEKELARSQFSYDDVNETVESILKDVKARGDKALIEYTGKFGSYTGGNSKSFWHNWQGINGSYSVFTRQHQEISRKAS